MRRIVVAVVLVAVCTVGPPQVTEAQAAPCQRGTPEEKGQAAMPMLRYPWRDLGYAVEFLPGRPGYLGLTYPGQRRIVLFVRECQTVNSVAHVFGHEVGHAVDLEYNDAVRRVEWERIRGFHAPWFPCDGCSDYRSGAGDFAEVFAFLKATPHPFRSAVAGPPTVEQAAVLEPFFHPIPAPAPPPPPARRGLLGIPGLLAGGLL